MAVLIVVALFLAVCTLSTRGPARLAFLGAGLFAVLAALAVGINADWIASVDASVESWFRAHRSSQGEADARTIFRFIGKPANVAFAALVCGIMLALQARSVVPAVLVVGAVGLGVVIEQAFKAAISRTSTAIVEMQDQPLLAHQHAFPSGHVTGSAALLGTIAVCLCAGRSRIVKAVLAGLVVAVVLFVSYITLDAKAHTFIEVIGGMILGGALVTLSAALLGASKIRARALESSRR